MDARSRLFTPTLAGAALASMLCGAAPAMAKSYSFRATLGGTRPPTMTGSPATGTARIRVDASGRRVSLDLDVTGIALDRLNAADVKGALGPVHFHDHHGADDNDVVFPVPYGAAYRATKTGFRVSLRDYDYAAGTKISGSSLTIDEFVTAMRAGRIVVDVATGRYPGGEIGGATTEG